MNVALRVKMIKMMKYVFRKIFLHSQLEFNLRMSTSGKTAKP